MADAPNTVATLNGLFKVVYADKLLDLVPDYAVLQKRIEFTSADKETGNYYAQPVVLASEAGFTYGGSAGGVATLNDAVAGAMKEAQVYGSELILRAQLSYNSLSRSSKSPKAFKKASAWKVEDMNNSMRKRIEIAMLYGQVGVATVSSLSSQVITITEASWAGGIWAGAENHFIDVFTASFAADRQLGLKISAVDSDARTLTIAGGYTTTGIASTDVIAFKGAVTSGGTPAFSEMAGLQKIITNSTTLFNIDASTYSLWKGTTVSSVGQLSFQKIQNAVSKAVNKGLMEKCLVLVSPKAFGTLNSDMAALRNLDGSYSGSKAENGAESLVFHSSNGALEILSHPMVKDGDAFILPEDALKRLGSCDLSFGVPGLDEEFFSFVPAKGAVEMQCYADQAIFLERPAHAVYLSGITYA